MNVNWMKEWKKKGLLDSPARKIAAERLEKAQLTFQELPSIIGTVVRDKKDPLTVEVFVETIARLGEQHSAEIQLLAVVLLEEIQKLQQK